jgi:hypothetical protein
MLIQALPHQETSSPTSVQIKALMSEFSVDNEQEPSSERKSKSITIHRRTSSEGNNGSGPLYYEHDDREMKMAPADKTSHVPSPLPPPPRCISAAEAEKETIFCLKRECKALKMAMKALPKHSKEWTMMNAKLEIAKDELQATLEDIDMTQNYSRRSTGSSQDKVANVPTPPVSSPFSLTPVKSFSRQGSSLGSDTDSSMEIHELFERLRPPTLDTSNKPKVNVVALKNDLEKAEKFSLEYFKIKKQIDRAEKRGASLSPSSQSSGGSVRSLQPPGSSKSFDGSTDTEVARKITTDPSISPPLEFIPPGEIIKTPSQELPKLAGENATSSSSQHQSIKVGNGLGNLVELLDVVPKYSLEWFNLKKDIKTVTGGQPPTEKTRKLRKHRSSFSVTTMPQFNRLDSAEVKYPIPHVGTPEPRKDARKRRAYSKERPRAKGTQELESLDAQYFYVRMRKNVITVQNLWRSRIQRVRFLRLKRAVICIQSTFRMSLRQNLYRQVLYGIIFTQSLWRGYHQRIKLHDDVDQARFTKRNAFIADDSEHSGLTDNSQQEDDEDFSRIQRSIDAMKNEKMSMEMKLLQLKNDIDVIKNEKLRQDLNRMRHDIESLEHLNEDVLFDNTAMSSVYSYDQTLESVPTTVFSVVLQQKGSLGLEMEHHKSSDSVRISFVKKRSQADKAGLQKGDIVINFRSQQYPDGIAYAQFIALAKQGVRPLVLEITRVDPSIVESSRRSGLFRKKKHR